MDVVIISVFCFFFDSTGEYNEPYLGKAYRNMLIYGAGMTNSLHNSNKTV